MIVRRMLNPTGWRWNDPFEELNDMRRRMEHLSRTFTGRQDAAQTNVGVFPLVNVTEDADNYRVRAELPGVNVDDLDISITGNSLAISGERKIAAEDTSAKYHRREREAGKFSRMIELPNRVDSEKVDAKLTNGVLTVTLPKSEAAKPRQIKVS